MPSPGPFAGLVAVALLPGLAAALPPGKLPLTPCQLSPPGASSLRVAARCGTLEVPEVTPASGHEALPGGRTLSLRVAVVEAEAGRAAPDAVFVLAGGPGQAATEVYPQVSRAFDRLHRKRDIVLVDQRGTGGSGKLECPDVPEPGGGRPLPPAQRIARVTACYDALARRTDLDAYGTTTFARDLDRVRAVLGYQKVNLVGFSYGTRAALVYLREYPDRVRTLVLDGVVPMQMTVGSAFDADAERAIGVLLRRCGEEPGCRARFPELERDLEGLLRRLERTPATVDVRDALTFERRTRTFGADELRHLLFVFAYAAETTALLPPLIHGAAAGDVGPLAAALQIVSGDLEVTIARPMQLSVVCAEDVPRFDGAAPPEGRWFGAKAREEFLRLCAAWPVTAAPASFHDRVRSDVPALLLSGEADPVTPPRWAELLREDLPRARHLVLPGQGHGVFFRGCLPRLAAAFVEAGTADGLDLACLERAHPAPPFLDAQGGSP
jgi:pimeloyl-ACP methyl ester carboxylesterase